MISKVGSLEEKVKLPPNETISRCYQPQGNRKVIRILTVAVYVLCVSLAAIMLSLYYIFIWDPTIRPFVAKTNNCDKIVIPEKIAIRLLNSSEVTAEQFYKHILEQYRILNQLQQQRQQYLQKQHLHLQQLAASGSKFQEVFATATIIQSNPNDRIIKPITPTNGTFLLEPPRPQLNPPDIAIPLAVDQRTAPVYGTVAPIRADTVPILDTAPVHFKRKAHRKHYSHHRHNGRTRNRAKRPPTEADEYLEKPALNPPASLVQEPPYTSMPIPLILNSKEDKRPLHRTHSHAHADKKSANALARKRTTSASVSGYDAQAYLNPFLTGELIFEK